MKLLTLTISAAFISGAAYADDSLDQYIRERNEYMAQRQAKLDMEAQREQLEQILAEQRQLRYEIENRQLFEQNRIRQEHYLRPYLEDCE